MIHRLPRIVTEHPKRCLAISLAVALLFGAFAPFVQTVSNVDYFTLEDHPDTVFYEKFKETFGNDEFFVIAFERSDIFTPENLRMIQDLTEKLEALEGVRRVVSLANVNETLGGENFFEVRPFLEEIPEDPKALEDMKRRALANPLYVGQVISRDGTTTAIVVFAQNQPGNPDFRKRVLADTRKILAPYETTGVHFHLAGWTVLNYNLSRYMQEDVFRFIPVTYLLIGLAVQGIFRRWRLTFLALANISVCLASTMGFFRISGILLNNVTVIVPPLVMALSLSDTVHIFSHLRRSVLDSAQGNPRRALARTLSMVIRPSFLTTVTTFVGFLSLAVSRIPPIRDFAWTASVGMVFEFFFAFFFLPPLLLLFHHESLYAESHKKEKMRRFLDAAARRVTDRARRVAAFCTLVMVAAGILSLKVSVETNLVEYFKPSDPMRRSLDFVERRLAGVGSLDVSLQGSREGAFKFPGNLRFMEQLQDWMESREGIDATLSLADFIKDMHQAFHNNDPARRRIPESESLIAQYLLLYGTEDLEDLVNEAFNWARISVRISEHRSSRQAEMLKAVQQYVRETAPEGLRIRLTGRAVQDVNTIHALVVGQIQSLALATALIWLIMIAALRSWKWGLLSFPPNLFPIVLNFGVMAILGIPLNTATALISAVAIGMAVDNTIHFLTAYAHERSKALPPEDAVYRVLLSKGRAMVSSSLILVIGFGVLVFSHFVPTIQFGLLCSLIMITALIGDLFLLPSLVILTEK